jgi:hypothetical protein
MLFVADALALVHMLHGGTIRRRDLCRPVPWAIRTLLHVSKADEADWALDIEALVLLLRREVARPLVPKRPLTISLTVSLLALGGDLVAKLARRPPAAIKQGGAVVSSSLAQTYATNSGMTASTFSTATNSVVNPFAS